MKYLIKNEIHCNFYFKLFLSIYCPSFLKMGPELDAVERYLHVGTEILISSFNLIPNRALFGG